MAAKVLELAIRKAASLPEEAQEQIGRDLIERIDNLARLRGEISIGVEELDAGLGRELDIDTLVGELRVEYARS